MFDPELSARAIPALQRTKVLFGSGLINFMRRRAHKCDAVLLSVRQLLDADMERSYRHSVATLGIGVGVALPTTCNRAAKRRSPRLQLEPIAIVSNDLV